MFSGACRLWLRALALAMGIALLTASSAMADLQSHGFGHEGRFKHGHLGYGTLGWAPYGLYPGLYGFSLRWHPGYGYGKYALGVGADGGYPFYGGPGYPHEPPHLRRFGPAAPYPYLGGPDFPILGWTNFYQDIGGLEITKPVVGIGEPGEFGYVGKNGEYGAGNDFGHFTGAIPYPETMFAPFAGESERRGSSGGEGATKPQAPPTAPSVDGPAPPSASLSPSTHEFAPTRSIGRHLPRVGNVPPPASR
jgi:hypothetical protein